MPVRSRRYAVVKFAAWAVASLAVLAHAVETYTSGTMVRWYYSRATADGYAVNTRSFEQATPERPAVLAVVDARTLIGPAAVRVRQGDDLPAGATGVIDTATVNAGRRVRLDGDRLRVLVPWEIREARGFTYRDGFTHKNVGTNPLAGLWNLVMVLLIGLCLGFLAEGFTDLVGLRLEKTERDRGPRGE